MESKYNEGSTFSFELKQKIVDAKSIAEQSSKQQSNTMKQYIQKFWAPQAHILLVDDNALNRVLIKRLLKNSGIIIDEAENGQVCLKRLEENTYDLILLDHMMPIMDGMETISHIQKLDWYEKGKPPIVALTANAIVGVEKEYLEAGFDAYLSKPIMPKSLDDVMKGVLLQICKGVEEACFYPLRLSISTNCETNSISSSLKPVTSTFLLSVMPSR